MAKLYAEIDSDRGGRKASKGGDRHIRIDVTRGNTKLGTFGVYEVDGGGYRIAWHPGYPLRAESHTEYGSVILADTTSAANGQHALRIISLHDAQAECTGCGFYYVFTGARTREEIEEVYNKAHSTAQ